MLTGAEHGRFVTLAVSDFIVAVAVAVAVAKLPLGTTAYTLRHSTITDLVDTRSPLLSVAQISGTNAEMIERHYGHLRRTETVETLSKLAL